MEKVNIGGPMETDIMVNISKIGRMATVLIAQSTETRIQENSPIDYFKVNVSRKLDQMNLDL